MDEKASEALAVSEDVGAALLSLVPVFGSVASGLVSVRGNWQTRRAIRFLMELMEKFDGRLNVLEAAREVQNTGELLEHGVECSFGIRSDDQHQLVVQIVADGIDSGEDGPIERAHVLLDIVAQLHPDHVRLLRVIGQGVLQGGELVDTDPRPGHGTPPGVISHAVSELAPVFAPLIAQLLALGLIEDVGMGPQPVALRVPGMPRPEADVLWALTVFGAELVNYLTGQSDD